jgi:hypothetical protein
MLSSSLLVVAEEQVLSIQEEVVVEDYVQV